MVAPSEENLSKDRREESLQVAPTNPSAPPRLARDRSGCRGKQSRQKTYCFSPLCALAPLPACRQAGVRISELGFPLDAKPLRVRRHDGIEITLQVGAREAA